MNFPSFRPRLLIRAASLCLAIFATHFAAADLVWTPHSGWHIEGGLLTALTENPAEARTAVKLMNRARAEQEIDNFRPALGLYDDVIDDYPTSILAPEAHFQSALIRIERKQWTKAFDHLQKIVDQYPGYSGFGEVIRQQYQIAEKLRHGARLRLFGILPGFRSPERAVEYYEQIVENAPYSEVAPLALLHAAEIQVKRNQLDEAIDLFDRMISEYPRHERIPEAYFGLAQTFSSRVNGPEYDQGATREAMTYYEDFAILHSQHPRAAEAEKGAAEMRDLLAQSRIVIGDFYFKYRNNFHAARVFYNEAITLSPQSPSAEEARQKLARVELEAAAHNP